jgi:hypothetical protein
MADDTSPTRARIMKLKEHGDFDIELISAITDLPEDEIEATLTDPTHTPDPDLAARVATLETPAPPPGP